MPTYKFEQFNVEITNPTIDVVNVSDAISLKTCAVDVVLTVSNAKFGVNLKGFTYTDTWDDQDVVTWVNDVELPKYEI